MLGGGTLLVPELLVLDQNLPQLPSPLLKAEVDQESKVFGLQWSRSRREGDGLRDDPVLLYTEPVPEEAVVHMTGLDWARVKTGNAQCLVCLKRLLCWTRSPSFLRLSAVKRIFASGSGPEPFLLSGSVLPALQLMSLGVLQLRSCLEEK